MKSINLKKIFLTLSFLFLLFTSVSVGEENILFDKTYDVLVGEELSVKVSAADIEISTWNKDEVQILVVGKKSVTEYFNFNFAYNNGVVSVVSEKIEDWDLLYNIGDLEVKVTVPSKFNLNLKTSGGDIEIENSDGTMEMKTSGGDIEIDNSVGNVVAKTSGGDIEVFAFDGELLLKTSGGDIEAKKVVGNIEAKTSGGDIELSVADGEVTAVTSGGDISLEYNGINEGIELRTSGGDIDIILPGDFMADVLLKSSSNSIDNNFKASEFLKITKSKFVGKYNGGGNQLIAKTSGGSVSVNQK